MTLVERLRAAVVMDNDPTLGTIVIETKLVNEAADFIERLSYNGIHTCHAGCKRLPCVQRREIEAKDKQLIVCTDSIQRLTYEANGMKAEIESLQRECERLKQYEFLYKGYYGDRDDESIRDQREGGK